MNSNISLRFAVAAALGLALAACDRDVTNTAERSGATVGQKLDSAIDKTQRKLDEAGQRIAAGTREAAADVRNATVDIKTGDAGRALGDTAITASVKADLIKDPDLSVLKIDVDTKDGVVTLNGLAGNEEARQRAEKMASAIKGVKEVHNFLAVKRA